MHAEEIDPCEVCRYESAQTLASSADRLHQQCPRCGEFEISGSACSVLNAGAGEARRARLSGWVREQNHAGVVPTITTYTMDHVFNRPLPRVSERAMGLLVEAERGQSKLGENFNINDPRFLSATYSANHDEVAFLLKVLAEQRLAEGKSLGGTCEILPAGYMKLDDIRHQVGESSQGFVAMWFKDELTSVYETGFEPGLLKAGYDAVRMDRLEHVNRIDDEIIRQINASQFVVADFTGHRGGVYFEAGYALGKDIPVFWTCRKSDMDDLHFDIRQFNCIDWEESSELASRLAIRIEAVVGAGPKKTT